MRPREARHQAAHEALEREVAARTRDLRTANDELRLASERQTETDRRYRAARRGSAGAGTARGTGALVTATATSAAVLGMLSLAFVVVDRAAGG